MRRLAFAALLAVAAPAQDVPPQPFGHSRHGGAFDEGPRRAAQAMPGLSAQVHFPVAGLAADAQRLFDQGVCQLHGFWYFEAERSFRQVAKAHPDCALAYWGMAMANVENKPRAAALAAEAVARSAAVPAREQAWVDAWAAYYRIDDSQRGELRAGDAERRQKAIAAIVAANGTRDEPALVKQLIKDLEAIVFACPDDIEAKAFLVVQNWLAYDWGNGVPIVCHAGLDALLDQVFAKAPLHPAHHYRVHLWDQEKAARALRSAAVLGETAPAIAHQWHMAGHIYAKLDRHAEAAWQQEASARVDHAHMQRDRVLPFLIHNYAHNQEWLARSLSYVGRAHEALAVAQNLVEIPRHPKWNTLDDDEHAASRGRNRLVSVCEEHDLWEDVLRLERDGYLDCTDSVRGEVARLSLLGRANYRTQRLGDGDRLAGEVAPLLVKARAERAAAVDKAEDEALAAKKPVAEVDKAATDAARERTDVVRMVLDLQRELRGERLLAAGDAKAAVAEFEAVKDFPKTLLADAYVAAAEPQKAIDLLEAEVKEHPGRAPTVGRLLFAHAAAFAATKKPEHKERVRDLMVAVEPLGLHVRAGEPPATAFQRRVGIAVNECGAPATEPAETAGFAEDFGERPALASLGPPHWRPFAAPALDLPCTDGSRCALPPVRGRATLVVFYLGLRCLHCVQQLEALGPQADGFAAAGIDVVAVGNDSLARTEDQLAALGAAKFPFPLAADPDLAAFRAFHCFDDFEDMPLHGTFLIDGAGCVRWQDLSADPFVQFEWLLRESRRLLALPGAPPAK